LGDDHVRIVIVLVAFLYFAAPAAALLVLAGERCATSRARGAGADAPAALLHRTRAADRGGCSPGWRCRISFSRFAITLADRRAAGARPESFDIAFQIIPWRERFAARRGGGVAAAESLLASGDLLAPSMQSAAYNPFTWIADRRVTELHVHGGSDAHPGETGCKAADCIDGASRSPLASSDSSSGHPPATERRSASRHGMSERRCRKEIPVVHRRRADLASVSRNAGERDTASPPARTPAGQQRASGEAERQEHQRQRRARAGSRAPLARQAREARRRCEVKKGDEHDKMRT